MVPCTACGALDTTMEPFRWKWNGRQFWLRRCPTCTHQFVSPSFTDDELAILYNDAYFEDGTWIGGLFENRYVDSDAQLRREARQVLGFLSVLGSILDVGCAGGTFLDEARKAGHGPVYGIELNEKMASHARDDYDIDVICGRLQDVADDHWRNLDVVVLMDTLEHLAEPMKMLQKIRGWMRSGGQLLVRGPMVGGVAWRAKEALRRTLWRVKLMPDAPRDSNFWNRRSLTASLRASGFEPKAWFDASNNFANVLAVSVERTKL